MPQRVIFVHWRSTPIKLHRYRSRDPDSAAAPEDPVQKRLGHEVSTVNEAMEKSELIPVGLIDELRPEPDEVKSQQLSDPDRGVWHELWIEQGTPAPEVLVLMYFDLDGPDPDRVRDSVFKQLSAASIHNVGLVLHYV